MKKIFVGILLLAASACTQKAGAVRDVTPAEADGLLRNDFAVVVDASQPVAVENLKKDKEVLLKNLPEGPSGEELVKSLSEKGYRVGKLKN